MPTEHVEIYMGCDIYYVTPPDVSYAIYRSPCIVGDYFKISAVKKRICEKWGGTWVNGVCELAPPTEPGEFRFDSYNPPLDAREIFPVGAPWPSVTKMYDPGESVYVHYAVKNIGSAAGGSVVTVKDLDTEPHETITTWIIPSLSPGQRFKTSGSGAYVGKMPGKDWRLEFKVDP